MAPGPALTRESFHQDLSNRPGVWNTPLALIALALTIAGILFFAQAQTIPVFNDGQTGGTTGTGTGRDDAGILTGALVAAFGLTILVCCASPLRIVDRIVPAAILGVCTTLILVTHFSIFTNGIALPDERQFGVKASFLFHDTHATLPIAPYSLAFITLPIIALAVFAALALVAPRALDDHLIRPRSIHAHRTRLLVVTLLLLGAGPLFVREFAAFAAHNGPSAMAMIYTVMAVTLVILLVTLAIRTILMLWGRLALRVTRRSRRRQQAALHLESGLCVVLLTLLTTTFMGVAAWEPTRETDPVFAIGSRGLSVLFLLYLGGYLLQRKNTHSYRTHLRRMTTRPPTIRHDLLLWIAASTTALWAAGSLWAHLDAVSPLGGLALRLVPMVLVLPLIFVIYNKHHPIASGFLAAPLTAWATLSILTGVILWGIANSVRVVFRQESGGLLTQEGLLLEPATGAIRLLAALLIAAPVLAGIWLLNRRNLRSPSGIGIGMAGLGFVFTMNVLLTIAPTARWDPSLGHTDVLLGFWINSLPATNTTPMLILTTLTASAALWCAYVNLRKGADPSTTRAPWTLKALLRTRSPRITPEAT